MKKIWTFVFLFLLLLGCTIEKDELILDGYFSSDEHWDKDGFQDYVDYCKYYYKSEDDLLFKENLNYREIGEEDINNIVSYFENFEGFMKAADRTDEYDFNIYSINAGDYVHIKTKEGLSIGTAVYDKFDNYSIYFYDVDSHTLIYIHANI